MMYPRSNSLFEEAGKFIPGGVNSPVRAFRGVGGHPVFIRSAKGAYLFDEDGNRYVDYINSWGPMILGHAFEPVLEAIREQLPRSLSFGAPTAAETDIASLILQMVPGMDRVRLVNSGTEACMSAIRLARGFTGRHKIIKFEGCYHGHADSFLIAAGSGAITFGSPDSAGVTPGTAADTLLAVYNSEESVDRLVQANAGEIAAIIIEPVAGNMGCIPPKPGFLTFLREICTQNGILLIFDEVMTGFRLAPGGAQEYFGIQADIATYGKVIGGGMPIAAFAARADIMAKLAPNGPVYQAGTLSGNPVAVAAGYAQLSYLQQHPEIYAQLDEKTAFLEEGLHRVLSAKGTAYRINRVGSMISVHFAEHDITDFTTAKQADIEAFRQQFHHALQRGIYLPPSAFETWFISEPLSDDDIRLTIDAFA